MKSKFIIGSLFIAIAGYFLGAEVFKEETNKTSQTSSKKLQVTASFYPLYYFASQIGGDKVNIANITPSGTEPHEYELTTQDRAKIENSRLLILNGGGLEVWADKINDDLKSKNVTVVTVGGDLITGKDPHIWLSPRLAKKQAARIAQALSEVDPANKLAYETNEINLEKRLVELDDIYGRGLSNCQRTDVITSHTAFGYLAQDYNLNQVSIAGLSPDEEPSPRQLAQVVKFAKEHDVRYIFFESLASPKLSETIASEIGAKTLVLDPLEGLADDDIKAGKNYFTVMKDNLRNLQLALECN